MQVEANDLHATKQILVKLIEEALERYHRSITGLKEAEGAEAHTNHLLLQLKSLLGAVLVDALTILDEQYIQLYAYEGNEIAEIQIKQQQYKTSHWLFPRINHCTCKEFKECVLGLKEQQVPATSLTASNVHVESSSYTCAHVLALRLAQVLQPTPTTYKVEQVTKQQFKNLQDRMFCGYLSLFRESLE